MMSFLNFQFIQSLCSEIFSEERCIGGHISLLPHHSCSISGSLIGPGRQFFQMYPQNLIVLAHQQLYTSYLHENFNS